MERSGEPRRHAVHRAQGHYRAPICLSDDANPVMLQIFVKYLKRWRRRVTRSYGDGYGMYAPEAVPDLLAMIGKAHFLFVYEDKLTDAYVVQGLAKEYNLLIRETWGVLSWTTIKGQ